MTLKIKEENGFRFVDEGQWRCIILAARAIWRLEQLGRCGG